MRAPGMLCLLCALLPAQQDAATSRADCAEARERFAMLGNLQKAVVLRRIVTRLAAEPDPHLQRILGHDRPLDELPEAATPGWNRAEDWAPGVAPARQLVREGEPKHQRVRAEIPRLELLPGLHRAIHYEWASGRIVQRGWRLSWDEIYENLLLGYPPGTDAALADALAALDREPAAREPARMLASTYADLNAQVYEGITLYEAWYSGKTIDIPDVDAIPLGRVLLGDQSFRSPIPADARREDLYRRIRDVATHYKRYRTLREAAAVAYVAAAPPFDPVYAPLIPRFHLLFALHGERLPDVAAVLEAQPDREKLLAHIDALVRGEEAAFAAREERQRKLAGMADKVRQIAAEEVLQ